MYEFMCVFGNFVNIFMEKKEWKERREEDGILCILKINKIKITNVWFRVYNNYILRFNLLSKLGYYIYKIGINNGIMLILKFILIIFY